MNPPTPDDHPEGGVFELLLENGDAITCPYPGQWHGYVAGAFQANDILPAVFTGIGEYSPDGRLLRIAEIEILRHNLVSGASTGVRAPH